jgi:glycosyltransferase involved in cell wall biosynthesis
LKIAYVITRADAVGGASIHVRDLARAMRDQGHDAQVFIGGTGPVTDQLATAKVPFISVPSLARSLHPLRDMNAYLELKELLAEFRPDLVSTHTAKAGWLGRAAARALGIPAIHTPHGLPIGDRLGRVQGQVYTVAEKIAAPWTRAIVCVSEAERQLALAKRVAPPEKLHVVYNGVRDNNLRAEPGRDPVRIISVARFEAPKDHETLLAALEQVMDLPWELVLVGDGPLEVALRARANDRVRFLGTVADTGEALANSQLFVLSSKSEGFPRSILEAMRAGLPVVASDVGGVAEAVEHGITGLLVPSSSPYELAHALRAMLESSIIRQRMGDAGHLRYQERFRFESMLSGTMRLYATIVGVPKPRPFA